jgi:antitoxin HicB
MPDVSITIKIEPLAEGGYLATSKDIQGLVVQGKTVAKALAFAQDAAYKLIESCIEHGDPLPPVVRRALKKSSTKRATATIPVVITQKGSPG